MSKQKFTPEELIEALNKSMGMIYVAARALGCHPNTVYNYAKRYKKVQAAIDQKRGEMIDTAELALWKALQNGEAWAVSLCLKTIGKTRGYVERQEITGADGGEVEIGVRFVDYRQGIAEE
jgi:hypothetical protein